MSALCHKRTFAGCYQVGQRSRHQILDIAQKPPKKAAHNPALHDRSVTSLLWLLVDVPLADRIKKPLVEAAIGRHLRNALPEFGAKEALGLLIVTIGSPN